MKIYTRTGDAGKTALLGGSRVSKHDLRIEAYGTVDELNAWVGMLSDRAGELLDQELLNSIQDQLFTIGSNLAKERDDLPFELPELKEEADKPLEKAMDRMDAELPPLRNFVLPGGHESVSTAHICRTVCRRAERRVAALQEEEARYARELKFLNRLSDYFFVVSRYLSQALNIEERPWKP